MSQDPHDRSGLPSRRNFLVSSSVVAATALAGCSGNGDDGDAGDGDTTSGDGGTTSADELSGTIRISGSSTVYPVQVAATEEFRADVSDDVEFPISRDGSTGGFEKFFLKGDSDINGSSRPILEEEVERARDQGFEPIEFQVAGDALTAAVNNDNDWAECITIEELSRIWSPDAENELWSDIRSEWPDEPFDLYGAATTSGTFDYWTREVVGELRVIRDDFEGTEEDDLIARGISDNQYAHGYLPYAYYDNNPGSIKALEIDGGEGCTEPSLTAASDGTYPLARPIFIYVNSNRLQEKEELQEFLRYYIELTGNQQIIAEEIGYVPMSDQEIQDNLNKLEETIE
ncbi:phosphate ABC transporter substrate-binding protein [Halobacteriales archaeon QH_10_67_13]|nr:MAG: phosphate ABC transporter substrate-binding protein [Halobacteriales archaeon QH_10_67_13]